MHLLMVYIFTFKNLRFGVYSYMHATHLNKILSNKKITVINWKAVDENENQIGPAKTDIE